MFNEHFSRILFSRGNVTLRCVPEGFYITLPGQRLLSFEEQFLGARFAAIDTSIDRLLCMKCIYIYIYTYIQGVQKKSIMRKIAIASKPQMIGK